MEEIQKIIAQYRPIYADFEKNEVILEGCEVILEGAEKKLFF